MQWVLGKKKNYYEIHTQSHIALQKVSFYE